MFALRLPDFVRLLISLLVAAGVLVASFIMFPFRSFAQTLLRRLFV